MASADFPEQLRDLIVASVEDDKAEGTVVLDLKGKSSLADYIVITSGRSARQVDAMAGHLLSKLKEVGLIGLDAEGTPQCDWVLIDAGDVLIHLFRPEVRAFYNLEKMWGVELPPDFAGFGAPASDFLAV